MSTDNATWTRCSHHLPPVNEVVMTKIDDALGIRNEQPLKLMLSSENRMLWYTATVRPAYVYYTPTHWQRMPAVSRDR
jgi:hypothetical protein